MHQCEREGLSSFFISEKMYHREGSVSAHLIKIQSIHRILEKRISLDPVFGIRTEIRILSVEIPFLIRYKSQIQRTDHPIRSSRTLLIEIISLISRVHVQVQFSV